MTNRQSQIPKLVIIDQNLSLMRPISREEVESTLKKMALGKSPRLDGFMVDFFNACYSTVGIDV